MISYLIAQDTPLGVSPVQQSQLLSSHTRAISIGQRTVQSVPGRPTSLDKCPSLQVPSPLPLLPNITAG